MTNYPHGIEVQETTAQEPVIQSQAGQFAVGTAPIHLLKDPSSVVNKLVVAYSLDEVKVKLGYVDTTSEQFNIFSLNEVTFSSFELCKVAPVVFVNVLDPSKHKKSVAAKSYTLTKSGVDLPDEPILLDSVVVKSPDDATTYVRNEDYTVAFNGLNIAVINAVSTSTKLTNTSEIKVSYDILDPTLVTEADIAGGYDVETGISTGIDLIRKVYPTFAIRPDSIIAPGYSHKPVIGALLQSKTEKINDSFNSKTYLDIDTSQVKKYEDAITWKQDNYYKDKRAIVLWPKVKRNGKVLHYSAVLSAYAARMVADDADGIPYESPSNKVLPIDAFVLDDGTEVNLELPQANALNGAGIVTGLLWAGTLRSWGSNTAIYPESKAPQNRYINVRSSMDWWGNTFINHFWDKVDDVTNLRLIESIVDGENARVASLQARGKIAGGKMIFSRTDNPVSDILNGKIVFKQELGLFGPAEHIVDVLEFNPSFLETALFGEGDQ